MNRPPSRGGEWLRRGGRSTLAVAVLLLAAAACGAPTDGAAGEAGRHGEDAPLLVLAAADLQAAMPELAEHFRRATGHGAEVVLGSTGNLTTQIEHGAPGDVFLAANRSFVDRLAERGLILPDTRRTYAIGPLVLVGAPGVAVPASVADLAREEYGTVAIANPEHAPYGMAAREALQAAGVWDAIQTRLVLAENITQALQFVRTGNADAGVVALGLVVQQPGVEYRRVDAALHAPLRQTGAVLGGSTRPETARAFLEFVVGEQGQAILRRYGFEPPDGP